MSTTVYPGTTTKISCGVGKNGLVVKSPPSQTVDTTNGAAKMMFKAKETGGTVRTGSVALA